MYMYIISVRSRRSSGAFWLPLFDEISVKAIYIIIVWVHCLGQELTRTCMAKEHSVAHGVIGIVTSDFEILNFQMRIFIGVLCGLM